MLVVLKFFFSVSGWFFFVGIFECVLCGNGMHITTLFGGNVAIFLSMTNQIKMNIWIGNILNR